MDTILNDIRDDCRKNLIKYTLQAFSFVPRIEKPLILDMGCGTGVPSLALLEVCDGNLVAVDTDRSALDWLEEKVQKMGLASRVTIVRESVLDFSLPGEKCDILLAEGLLNVFGFKSGLPLLLRQVKAGGYLIIHDEYKHDSKKKKIFDQYHLSLIGSFELDEKIWWEEYYDCLEQKVREADKDHLFEKEIKRIKSYKSNPRNCRSIYYILQK